MVTSHSRSALAGRASAFLFVLAGLAAAACLGAPGAAAACPNEAFRVGASALLPECRAYEQVSPVDKGGANVAMPIEVSAAPSGDAAAFYASAAFAEAPGNPLIAGYIGRRGADNWTTESISPPGSNPSGLQVLTGPASSLELDRTLQYSKVALAPGAIEGGSNVYIRDNLSGGHTLVVAQAGNALFSNLSSFSSGRYLAATPDFSHVVFQTSAQLLPEAPPNATTVYEFADGQLSIVNRLPDGTVSAGARAEPKGGVPYAHAISEDGSRIFFMPGSSSQPLYMREDGLPSVAISASQKTGEVGTARAGEFGGASADGGVVYFSSSQKLTDASTVSGESLYRYDVASGQLTDLLAGLTVSTGFRRVMAVSRDGSYVYFAARGALTPDSVEAGTTGANLYVWHAGTLEHIAEINSASRETQGPPQRMASPSGDQFAFATAAPLSPQDPPSAACPSASTDNGMCRDVYSYDASSGVLSCLTCTGSPAAGHSDLGGQLFHERGMGDEWAHPVLEDGTVFFDTPNRLVVADVNGVGDAYAWRQGARWLISTGTDPAPSNFGDATADGSSVFFRTGESLVPQDVDANVDLYAARVNGGLAGQYPPAPPPPCEGEGCRGASPQASPSPLPSTESPRDDDNLPAACLALERKARAADRRADALQRRLRLAEGRGARTLRRQLRQQRRKSNQLTSKGRICGGQA